jgi:hypothetical protein
LCLKITNGEAHDLIIFHCCCFNFLGSGFVDEKDFVSTVVKFWKPVNTEEDIIDAFKVST